MFDTIVSIIIPCYNRANFISETLDSIICQSFPHWEAIVVDDGSTDNSIEVVYEYTIKDARIKFFHRNREPKNASVCRNIGIENAKGEYLIFLDSDDILASTCLDKRVEFMLKNKVLNFSVFQMGVIENKKIIKGKKITEYKENYLYSFLSHSLPWQTSGPIWHSSFIREELKGFNESYPRLQDVELHTRALLVEEVEFKVLPEGEPDSYYRNHTSKSFDGFILIKSFSLYVNEFHEKTKGREDNNICEINLKSCFKEAIRSYYSYKKKGFNKNELNLVFSFSRLEYKRRLISFQILLLINLLAFLYYLHFERTKTGKYILRFIMKLIKQS